MDRSYAHFLSGLGGYNSGDPHKCQAAPEPVVMDCEPMIIDPALGTGAYYTPEHCLDIITRLNAIINRAGDTQTDLRMHVVRLAQVVKELSLKMEANADYEAEQREDK